MILLSRHYGKLLCELLTRKNATASAAQPAAVFFAALETAPTGASTGSTISDAKWTGYKRPKTEGAVWEAASEGATCEIVNKTEIEVPYSSGEGKVKYCAIVDAETGGNVIAIGELAEELTVNASHSPLKFAPGEIKFQIASS